MNSGRYMQMGKPRSMPREKPSSNSPADSKIQPGWVRDSKDLIVQELVRQGLEVKLENYLALSELASEDGELDPEELAQLPEELQEEYRKSQQQTTT